MPKRTLERLTPAEIRALLTYDPATGVINWIGRPSIRVRHAGAVAGSKDQLGYWSVSIKYRRLRGHTIAWILQTGAYPEHEIDHINGDKADNRWANLRAADRSTNMQNLQRARRDSRSGLLGARLCSDGKHWTSEIRVQGKRHYLGCFKTAEEAHAAYVAAKHRLHPGNNYTAGWFESDELTADEAHALELAH